MKRHPDLQPEPSIAIVLGCDISNKMSGRHKSFLVVYVKMA